MKDLETILFSFFLMGIFFMKKRKLSGEPRELLTCEKLIHGKEIRLVQQGPKDLMLQEKEH